MTWGRAGGTALGLWWAISTAPVAAQLPILAPPPDEPSLGATAVASSAPPSEGTPPPAASDAELAWPTLPARGGGIETFRQDLEAVRAALESRRVAGEVDERTYAREMRRYYELYRAYRQRVR